MEGELQSFQISEGKKAVEYMKYYTSYLMKKWQEALRSIEYPEEIDYDSKEEYEAALKDFNIEIIEDIKEIKEDIFSGVVNSYNQFLAAKHQFETVSSKENTEWEKMIMKADVDIKTTGIICLTFSLMIPQAAPLIIMFNIPRVLYEMHTVKKGKNILSKNYYVEQKIKEIQDPFFEFTCTLRSDYHDSKRKLDELKKRVTQGENIEKELLDMFNAEKLSLPKIEEDSLDITEDKQKILEKK